MSKKVDLPTFNQFTVPSTRYPQRTLILLASFTKLMNQ